MSGDDDSTSRVHKKIKLEATINPKLVHSSLGHTSFKAPPLVEYNSIDSYCERKLGKSLIPSHSLDPPSAFDLNSVKNIGNPILMKSPDHSGVSRNVASTNVTFPYTFFSVEELSLVKRLSNVWLNTKVCPVGRVEFETQLQQSYLHSVLEKGSWQVLLDTTLLKEIPKLHTVLQIFGCIEVFKEKPVLKVHFYRSIRSADINLFVKSYKLMQNYTPNYLNLRRDFIPSSSHVINPEVGFELNDTLDDYDLSIVEKCISSEERNEHVNATENVLK